MASHDLNRILAGWEYEADKITVRKITGEDQKEKIQLRLDLGVLQMELDGRPDGKRPNGYESLLDYHQHQLEDYKRRTGTDMGFALSTEECQSLREESVQYYHRYLAEFVLEDFEGVDRDTARNLKVLDLCKTYAQADDDRDSLEQYRPYLIMMNTRAQVHMALRRGVFKTALARVDNGLDAIYQALLDNEAEEQFEDITEVAILKSLRSEIVARLPVDPIEKLERELQKAVSEERYEDAAVLQNRVDAMRSKKKVVRAARRRRR